MRLSKICRHFHALVFVAKYYTNISCNKCSTTPIVYQYLNLVIFSRLCEKLDNLKEKIQQFFTLKIIFSLETEIEYSQWMQMPSSTVATWYRANHLYALEN